MIEKKIKNIWRRYAIWYIMEEIMIVEEYNRKKHGLNKTNRIDKSLTARKWAWYSKNYDCNNTRMALLYITSYYTTISKSDI